ncbi:hypothetical protein quinque_016014 [Culex quinquefasciatus]
MLAAVKNFFTRHRRKFVVTGIVLGSGVFLIKIIQYKLREFQERQAKEIAERFKRMQHYESTERTCNQTIVGLAPTVSEKALKNLGTAEILEKLRSNPDNKLELWEELKILAFARIVTLVYASSMLAVTLKTQINLLGGYLYKDTVEQDDKQVTVDIQTTYLSMIQHFMGDGLDELMDTIQKNVTTVMQRYSLKQQLTLADAETLFWSIQVALSSEDNSPTKCIASYTLPKEINRSDLLSKMYDETLDVLESAEVSDVCLSNISNGFSLIVDKLAEYYAEAEPAATQQNGASTKAALNVVAADCGVSNINNIKISLAKLIPIVNGLSSKALGSTAGGAPGTNGLTNGFDQHRNGDMMASLVARFMQSEKLKTLGVNVYETFCHQQSTVSQKLYEGSQKFALNFFKKISEFVDSDPSVTTTNIIISPLSVWTLLALLTEGADGKTLRELLDVLNVDNQNDIKYNFKNLIDTINVNTSEVEISSLQLIFTDITQQRQQAFDDSIVQFYGQDLLRSLDFNSSPQARKNSYETINGIVSNATKGQIEKAIHPSDLKDAKMLILSVLFFKGDWTLPFNRSQTVDTPFLNENDVTVGPVPMMYSKAVFPFAAFRELEAQIVELPYGTDRHLSMMVILPRKGVPLKDVIGRLANFSMQTIYQELRTAAEEYEDDEVEVYLPRFEITADYKLKAPLFDMGVKAAMSKETAQFDRMANGIFLGDIVQKARIVVNEEGTTASASTAAIFANKATPPRFFANRPFAFLIVDKRFDVILFMGQVKNPLAV